MLSKYSQKQLESEKIFLLGRCFKLEEKKKIMILIMSIKAYSQ